MLVIGKKKIEDLIENFDSSKTYQIQNLSNNSIRVYQGEDKKKVMVLGYKECFLYQKGSLDYYIEGYDKRFYISYWELEE